MDLLCSYTSQLTCYFYVQKILLSAMTMSAVERDSQDEIDHDSHKEGQDFKSSINKAVNNVLEGLSPSPLFLRLFVFLLHHSRHLFKISLRLC